MEDDPWGSTAVDPWTTSKHAQEEDVISKHDPSNVPKDFILERRPSASADPWATEQAGSSLDDDDLGEKTTGSETEGLPLPSASWAANTEDDGGWGTPAPIVEKDEVDHFSSLEQDRARFGVPKSYAQPTADQMGPADSEVQEGGLSVSTPALPVIDQDSDGFRSPSPPIVAPAECAESDDPPFKNFPADDEDLDVPAFPTTSSPLPTFRTSIPESPSFGDDAFGGFSGGLDDPAPMPAWEPARKDDDDGWGSPNFGSPDLQVGASGRVAVDAWGEEREVEEGVTPVGQARDQQEDEWDRARKAIERREAVAPTELVAKLEREWRQIARECYGSKGASAEQNHSDEDAGLSQDVIDARDQLARELGSMPPEIDTFQHNLAMSMTWARYQDALTQINLDTRTSVLALVSRQSAMRAARRSSSEWQKEFQSRNRVDDSQATKDAQANVQAEEARPKWSFWGRRQSTQVVPLVTSGGGILEVKALSPSNTGNASLQSGSKTPLPVTQQITSPMSTGATPSINSSIAVTTTSSLPGSVAPLAAQEQAAEPAPGAVGRFFGRFRRPRASTPSVDVNNQDLELTKDDFSFLDQVPTAPPVAPKEPGIGDLLSLNGPGGRSEQMASLESMLSSKPVALPSRLAPPPISKRTSSAASIPKLGPSSRSSSHVDMFGDLDLSSPSPPITAAKPTTASNGLFELMASGSSTPQSAKPTAMPKDFDFFGIPPAAGPSKPAPPPVSTFVAHAAPPPIPEDDDDFGDFGQTFVSAPAQGNQTDASFDDFGDFGGFDAPAPNKPSQPAIVQPRPQSSTMDLSFFDTAQATRSTRPSEMNFGFTDTTAHAATQNLVQKAAERRGRWPAPPSPVPDALSPPPGSNSFFPRIDSPNTSQLNTSTLLSGPPRPAVATPPNHSVATPFTSTTTKDKRATLSAQDLSFFDSL